MFFSFFCIVGTDIVSNVWCWRRWIWSGLVWYAHITADGSGVQLHVVCTIKHNMMGEELCVALMRRLLCDLYAVWKYFLYLCTINLPCGDKAGVLLLSGECLARC